MLLLSDLIFPSEIHSHRFGVRTLRISSLFLWVSIHCVEDRETVLHVECNLDSDKCNRWRTNNICQRLGWDAHDDFGGRFPQKAERWRLRTPAHSRHVLAIRSDGGTVDPVAVSSGRAQ